MPALTERAESSFTDDMSQDAGEQDSYQTLETDLAEGGRDAFVRAE